MGLEFFDKAREVMQKLESTQKENIHKAALLISESIRNGGILQAYGSGHSYAGAIEVCGRAGGLIPSKLIGEPQFGEFEAVEGNAFYLMRKVDIRPNDIFILISNSGRNPMTIEMAEYIKKKGNPLIVVTALEVSKRMVIDTSLLCFFMVILRCYHTPRRRIFPEKNVRSAKNPHGQIMFAAPARCCR